MLEVTGIKESTLVSDKQMQTNLINGFSSAIGVPASKISITQIGNTKLNTRKLAVSSDGKLSISFEVKAASSEAAKLLQKQVESTPVTKINEDITAAGATGITATSSPAATVSQKKQNKKRQTTRINTTGFIEGFVTLCVVAGLAGYGYKRHYDQKAKQLATEKSIAELPPPKTQKPVGGSSHQAEGVANAAANPVVEVTAAAADPALEAIEPRESV
jgi:hypothetical protein